MHLLVVDDDAYVLETLQGLFELEDAKVTTATDGNKAFELLTKPHSFDLVLSDVRMPNCSGIELLKKLRDYEKKVPDVILVSAFSDISPKQANSMGAAAIFAKKDVVDRLVEHVKEKKAQKDKVNNEVSDVKDLDDMNILNFTIKDD